ncbi:MAG: hypothetical protein U0841_02280 [Chloroflexia bacterium]
MSAGICRRARCAKVTAAAKSPSPGDHRAHGVGLSEQRVSPELPRIGLAPTLGPNVPLQIIDPRLHCQEQRFCMSRSPPMTQVQADQSSIRAARVPSGVGSRAGANRRDLPATHQPLDVADDQLDQVVIILCGGGVARSFG